MCGRFAKSFGSMCCVGAMLVGASSAMAISVEDFVAVRILEPPAIHPLDDCEAFAPQEPRVHPCGAGPGYAGGIGNDGNVVGPLETNHPHLEPWAETIRWLRSTGYEGENVGRLRMMKGLRYVTGGGVQVSYPGPAEAPTAFVFHSGPKGHIGGTEGVTSFAGTD